MTSVKGNRPSWPKDVNLRLKRQGTLGLKVLDLFCGAGGFSLGFWAVGFDVVGIDLNSDAVSTYTRNLGEAHRADLRTLSDFPHVDVVIAGPPCQPWSRAGKQLGSDDEREGLAPTIKTVRYTLPRAVVVENVPGMGSKSNRHHLDRFKRQLRALGYRVTEFMLNAASFGVPQNRHRIFVVAVRGTDPPNIPDPWSEPVTARQAIPGTWWRLARGSSLVSENMSAYIERYERASGCRTPRDLHLDQPSRTLTVRNLSGATGDMMRLRMPDGRRRTLTIREAARLQSFPDWYCFLGSGRSKLEQIGNAVPPLLAQAVASSIRDQILENQ